MIRTALRKLRLIRYYSANRERTPWSKALDVGLVAALILALPATWVSGHINRKFEARQEYPGRLVKQEGTLLAVIVNEEEDLHLPWPEGAQHGRFLIRFGSEHRGWPLTITTSASQPKIDLELFSDGGTLLDVQLSRDDELWQVIDDALGQKNDRSLSFQWRNRDLKSAHHLLDWFFSIALWWIILSFAAWGMTGMVMIGWMIHKTRTNAHSLKRREAGLCPTCGYDLRGLDFSARCPECGSLMY